jgi:hypothetical protein
VLAPSTHLAAFERDSECLEGWCALLENLAQKLRPGAGGVSAPSPVQVLDGQGLAFGQRKARAA